MRNAMYATVQTRYRIFAELPFSQSWRQVRQHVGRLAGACVTEFNAEDGHGRIGFIYKGHRFSICSRDKWLEFYATEAPGLDMFLSTVQSHFAELLAPGTRD
jgi:hypothetical protein